MRSFLGINRACLFFRSNFKFKSGTGTQAEILVFCSQKFHELCFFLSGIKLQTLLLDAVFLDEYLNTSQVKHK